MTGKIEEGPVESQHTELGQPQSEIIKIVRGERDLEVAGVSGCSCRIKRLVWSNLRDERGLMGGVQTTRTLYNFSEV
jgi:hypothetical protein